MINDYVKPEERISGPGRRPGKSRIRNAWLYAHWLRNRARVANWLTDRVDSIVLAVTWASIGILVWLAWDDLVAWAFNLPPVTL